MTLWDWLLIITFLGELENWNHPGTQKLPQACIVAFSYRLFMIMARVGSVLLEISCSGQPSD